jgi:hypothetical protein
LHMLLAARYRRMVLGYEFGLCFSLNCAQAPHTNVPFGRGGHALFGPGTQDTSSPQSAHSSTWRLRGGFG